MKLKTYPLGDGPAELRRSHCAVMTGEKRQPLKGEWFISGAIPQAYQAGNDLSQVYYIARIVRR